MPTSVSVSPRLEQILVLPEWVLRQIVRQLAANPAAVLAGEVRIRTTSVAREYLLERVDDSAGQTGPRGRAALACGCVFTGTPVEAPGESLAQWVRQAGWAPEQWLVAVRLDARRPGWWEGMVWTGDDGTPLTRLHPVGGPLPVLQRVETSAEDLAPGRSPRPTTGESRVTGPAATETDAAQTASVPTATSSRVASGGGMPGNDPRADTMGPPRGRDSRTRGALGERVAARLRGATVTLVGAGRNGTQMAQQLAALGIGRLRMLDPDRLDPENLDGTPGLAEADVGRPKVEALARLLHAYRPELALALSQRSTRERAGVDFLAERADLLVTCVDDDLPRLLVALMARQTLTPHLDVGTRVVRQGGGWELTGDARLLLPTRGCVVCVGGLADLPAVVRDLHLPAGALLTRSRRPWHAQRAGSLVTINALAVGAGLQLWLDLLAGSLRQSYWQRLVWRWGTGLQADGGGVTAEPGCGLCAQGALPTGAEPPGERGA